MEYENKKHEAVIKSYNDYQKKNEEQKYNPSLYYNMQAWNVIIDLRVTHKGWYYVYTQNFFLRKYPKNIDKPIEKNLRRNNNIRNFERYGYYKSFEKAKNLYYFALMEYAKRLEPIKNDIKNELFETFPNKNKRDN